MKCFDGILEIKLERDGKVEEELTMFKLDFCTTPSPNKAIINCPG